MNLNTTKKFKPSNDCGKSSLEGSEQEVIVLPPNLLEQLGINLGNIQENLKQKEPEDKIVGSNRLQNEQKYANVPKYFDSNTPNETSITKTASLMKKSILLSPSFSPANVSVPKEVEKNVNLENISIRNDAENLISEKSNAQFNDMELILTHTDVVEDYPSTKDIISEYNENNSLVHNEICNGPQGNIDSSQLILKPGNINLNAESKPKINILSQEIICPETFNKLKISSTSKTDFIPFTINTPIPKLRKKSLDYEVKDKNLKLLMQQECNNNKKLNMSKDKLDGGTCSENNIFFKDNVNKTLCNIESKGNTTEFLLKNSHEYEGNAKEDNLICDDACNDKNTENICNTDNIANSYKPTKSLFQNKEADMMIVHEKTMDDFDYALERKIMIVEDSYKKNVDNNNKFSEIKITNKTIKNTCKNGVDSTSSQNIHCSEILEDKVKEIANYLNQCLLPDNASIASRRFLTKSKLSIQGVEKPGGKDQKDNSKLMSKFIKTYNRKTINRRNELVSMITQNNVSGECYEINDNASYPYLHCLVEQFCVCNDFGSLNLNDFKNEYQHIHFLNNSNVGTSLSTLFEIYNDECYALNKEKNYETDNTYVSSCLQELDKHCNMCYTEFSKSDYDIDFETNVNNLLDVPRTHFPELVTEFNKDIICIANNVETRKDKRMKPKTGTSISFLEPLTQGDVIHKNVSSEKKLEETKSNVFFTKIDKSLPNRPFREKNEITNKKRRRSSEDQLSDDGNNASDLKYKKNSFTIKCGICSKELSEVEWENHASQEHCYIAWKEGHKIDFTDFNLKKKLMQKLKEVGKLKCTFCNLELKSLKKFIVHSQMCIKIFYNSGSDCSVNDITIDSEFVGTDTKSLKDDELIRCGVCNTEVLTSSWMNHIAAEHNYQAWKSDEPPLDLNDEIEMRQHLQNITKQIGRLVCSKCGLVRKYVKAFMQHIKSCDGTAPAGLSVSDQSNDTCTPENENDTLGTSSDDNSLIYTGVVKCGVCLKDVDGEQWLEHIFKEHDYLARVEGKSPLDPSNDEEIEKHLRRIRSTTGYLACAHCGLKRKFIKTYLQHVQSCRNNSTITSNVNDQLNETCTSDKITSTLDTSVDDDDLMYTGVVKCGVCLKAVDGNEWLDHIQKEHNYLARIEGKPPLDPNNKEEVEKHLRLIRSLYGYLTCAKCGMKRKFIKTYMQHAESCHNNSKSKDNLNGQTVPGNNLDTSHQLVVPVLNLSGPVKCGVCDEEMDGGHWTDHIQKEHNYLAWIKGNKPLDVYDDEQVWNYLNNLSKQIGGLVCAKCGINRKYVKAYLQHVKTCDGSTVTTTENSINGPLNVSTGSCNTLDESSLAESIEKYTGTVKCGVCASEMDGGDWLDHSQKVHNYVAWVEGKKPLDLFDQEQIWQHLNIISKQVGGLICPKCGLNRKYVKAYIHHVKICDGTTEQANESAAFENVFNEEENDFVHKGIVKCGVCEKEVVGKQWIDHIHKQHAYMARIADRPPLNVEDEEEVRRHLTNLKRYVEELVCTNCGLARKSVKSYLRHIKNCDGSEVAELEGTFNDTCDMDVDCNTEDSDITFTGVVNCGVCGKEIEGADWLKHAQTEHEYLAWVDGKPPLDVNNEESVRQHLYKITKQMGGLVCSKCGLNRKYVKSYLQHVKNCDGKVASPDELLQSSERLEDDIPLIYEGIAKCGACHNEIEGDRWLEHIQKEHNYLARLEGKPPLDLKNVKQVQRHLYVIAKHTGGLVCAGCGITRMYVKSYLRHLKNCDLKSATPIIDPELFDKLNDSLTIENVNDSTEVAFLYESEFVYDDVVECGVCHAKVEGAQWMDHIQKEHNYLARIEGREPLDKENKLEEVQMFLYAISKTQNGLICKTCGAKRKYVKSFLQHIETCTIANIGILDEDNLLQCAVCMEKVSQDDWRLHAMRNHYNIAWAVGMEPIDLKNSYAVEKYLKDYKQVYKNLICKVCKISRVSSAGFYAHIITCGKSEEEIEFYKSFCNICNCKYLCIYKNQHLAMHREQEYAKERKLKVAEVNLNKHIEEEENPQGRRKAAEKAKSVIENYKTSMNQFNHKCSSCGFATDIQRELDEHNCESYNDALSESEGSVHYDVQSEEETESDVDSNVSNEEEERLETKKKRSLDPSLKIQRLPFKVNSASTYVLQGATDFFNTHYTTDVLFSNWRACEYEEVRSEDLPKYLPPLEESCKVKVANDGWITYNRFEAKKNSVCSLFAGGCVRCVLWVPSRIEVGSDACGNFLSVAAHIAADSPRLPAARTYAHSALLQIWDFGDFARLPKFALGIAHDYGTVWAMDWCPSGARDYPPAENDEINDVQARLGLVAIACSNGGAYVLVVPYPRTNDAKEAQIIKIKPAVELRLCSGGERKKYQATAISWSQQKGHSIILVGYADGTTAFYDLDCDSPLLRSVEDGVTILNPFQDDRPHNTCVLDVGLFPSGMGEVEEVGSGWGAWSGASCTGVHAQLRASAPRQHAPLATARASFTPHWPSVLITADEAIANHTLNELEWQGSGRRLGGQRALATCARCGLGVVYAPPVLRASRPHPAYRDPRRDMVGFLRMAPLAKKRSKHVNDELSMKVEPLIYEDAIKEYGIEFKLKCHMDKVDNQVVYSESKQHFPERFPLADVASMAFCTSAARHGKLAIAAHAGLVFVVNI